MLKNPIITFALLTLCSSAAGDDRLPRPADLEPNVRFWIRTYSEVDGEKGLLHDRDSLDVVYEVLPVPSGLSSRATERRVEKAKARIRDTLRTLARGKRKGLSPEEQRILALWPSGISNASLERASRSIRFQLGQADKFRAGLIRQGAWKAYIEQVMVDHGVPEALTALPHVESSYNERAYSRVGAAGLWQFTRSTGRRYLRLDNVVDERLDTYRSTVAAARLLRDNYKRTLAWPLAITAYNHGASGVLRAVRKTGSRDIGTISKSYRSRTFGFASRNFYAEFLAASEIDQNPERYFGPLHRDLPVAAEIVEMPHYYTADTLARALGVDTATLREFNPALRPSVWNGSKYVPRGYELRIPQSSGVESATAALAKISKSEQITAQHRDRLYKVQRGDSLSLIASRYGVSVRQLATLNNLRSQHRIRAGQVLVLPDAAGSAGSLARRLDPPTDGYYTVRRGDSVSSVASRFGVPEAEIVAFNDLRNRNAIAVGQRLRLTKPTALASAAAPILAGDSQGEGDRPAEQPPVPFEPERHLTLDQAAVLIAAAQPYEVEGEDPGVLQPLAEPAATAPPERVPEATNLVAALDFELYEGVADFEEEIPSEFDDEDLDREAETPEEPEAPLSAAGPVESEFLPDPSHYAVAESGSIVVQADETLGHYAEWLEVQTSKLRKLNRMRRHSTVVIGRPIALDFARVSPETFERRRLDYHRTLQEEFFGAYSVTGTETHVLSRGDTMWYLARQKYKLPVWLLRQYNPDLDFAALPPGSRMVIPSVEPRQG